MRSNIHFPLKGKSVIFSAGFNRLNSVYLANIPELVPRGPSFTPYRIAIQGNPSIQVLLGEKKRHLRVGLTVARGRGSIHQDENCKESCT